MSQECWEGKKVCEKYRIKCYVRVIYIRAQKEKT